MLWLYRILFFPIFILLSPYYLRRMSRRGGYRANFSNRFGSYGRLPPKMPGRRRVWLQAVSVGEMLAIGPILEALHRDGVEIYLTTTTSTGYRLASDRYAPLVLGIGYFPIDAWLFSVRAWRALQPDLAIVTEGERWPEHAEQARRRGVPLLCINARLSERSFRRLTRFPFVARLMLRNIALMLPGSSEDEARFRSLGFPPERLRSTGNIKLDVAIPRLDAAEQAKLVAELGFPAGGLILLGSSTWPGEEAALLEAFRLVRADGMRCSLLLVPRHAERRFEIEKILRGGPWRWHFRSRGPVTEPKDVVVGDTTGELRKLTQVADLVFIGKSLPPHTEGQTPVEAAVLGRAMVFGQGMANFLAVARSLVERGAAQRVGDAESLVFAVRDLLRDSARRDRLAACAGAWQRENLGAASRTIDIIREELSRR